MLSVIVFSLLTKKTNKKWDSDLNELFLQLVDGQTFPLLQDGELGLLTVRGLVAPKGMFLPLWDVIGHHANASHVCCNLPPVSCEGD